MSNYQQIATEARLKVLDLIYAAQTSHIGSNFSCIDILTVLFDKFDWTKDKFILSAGWKAASLYYFLWKAGKITEEELNSYCQEGSKFIGLAEPIIPEIPFSGGSMGMGLPAAVGFAMAKKLKGEEGTVYCLMSDGELQIGTTWEAALIAAQHDLNNLVVIVDNNGLQAMGKTNDILSLGRGDSQVGYKFSLFNWLAIHAEGHNLESLANILSGSPNYHPERLGGAPKVIIAQTIKGKGVSFMEGNNLYHYKAPSEEEYLKAKEELCLK